MTYDPNLSIATDMDFSMLKSLNMTESFFNKDSEVKNEVSMKKKKGKGKSDLVIDVGLDEKNSEEVDFAKKLLFQKDDNMILHGLDSKPRRGSGRVVEKPKKKQGGAVLIKIDKEPDIDENFDPFQISAQLRRTELPKRRVEKKSEGKFLLLKKILEVEEKKIEKNEEKQEKKNDVFFGFGQQEEAVKKSTEENKTLKEIDDTFNFFVESQEVTPQRVESNDTTKLNVDSTPIFTPRGQEIGKFVPKKEIEEKTLPKPKDIFATSKDNPLNTKYTINRNQFYVKKQKIIENEKKNENNLLNKSELDLKKDIEILKKLHYDEIKYNSEIFENVYIKKLVQYFGDEINDNTKKYKKLDDECFELRNSLKKYEEDIRNGKLEKMRFEERIDEMKLKLNKNDRIFQEIEDDNKSLNQKNQELKEELNSYKNKFNGEEIGKRDLEKKIRDLERKISSQKDTIQHEEENRIEVFSEMNQSNLFFFLKKN